MHDTYVPQVVVVDGGEGAMDSLRRWHLFGCQMQLEDEDETSVEVKREGWLLVRLRGSK